MVNLKDRVPSEKIVETEVAFDLQSKHDENLV